MLVAINRHLRRIFHRILHPFDELGLMPGQPFFPLDAAAERLSVPAVERFFEGSPAATMVAKALVRYFDDAEAFRALKKDYQSVFEQRLRCVALHVEPAETHGYEPLEIAPLVHPVDRHAFSEVQSHAPNADPGILKITFGSHLRQWVSLFSWIAAFFLSSAYILIFHGASRVRPRQADCVSYSSMNSFFWTVFADVLGERGIEPEKAMVFVNSNNPPFASISTRSLKVPRSAWLKRVVLPGFRLTATVVYAVLAGARDPSVVEAARRCFGLVCTALDMWRLAFNVEARWLIDASDYSSANILRLMIFHKFETKLVRWPFTQSESPGVFCSYLGYDLYLSGGNYQIEEFGHNWYPKCRSVPVGQPQNDRRFAARDVIHPVYSRRVTEQIAKGRKLIVYFVGNNDPAFNVADRKLLEAVLPRFANRDDICLVFKRKKMECPGDLFEWARHQAGLARLLKASNVIVLPHNDQEFEVLSSPWLIERMDLGFSLQGSIQVEAFAKGKPIMAYFPTIQKTPAKLLMQERGFFFDDPRALCEAADGYLDTFPSIKDTVDWVKRWFAPFAEECALDRIADVLFDDFDGSDPETDTIRPGWTLDPGIGHPRRTITPIN